MLLYILGTSQAFGVGEVINLKKSMVTNARSVFRKNVLC